MRALSEWKNKFGNNFTDNYGNTYRQAMEIKNMETNGAYQAKVSGDYGEFTASSILKALPSEYHVMNDILLQQGIMKRPYQPQIYGQSKWQVVKERGRMIELVKKSTQLDHLIVSPYGLFVIETKNHKGYVFGDIRGAVWTQVLNKGQAHYTFHNPVAQNETHLKELSNQLRLGRQFMVGMIVFTNPEAYLGNVNCNCCFTLDMLYNAIMSYNKPIWDMKQTEKVILAIEKLDSSSYTKAKEHEMYVQDLKERQEINRRRKRGY